MHDKAQQFYINGQWVQPKGSGTHSVINPTTEQPLGDIAMGNAEDVDAAVKAAHTAFPAFSSTSREQRLELLDKMIAGYEKRFEDIARTISTEMGSPITFSRKAQTQVGLTHFKTMRKILETYEFEKPLANGIVRREPVGVCGLITPWNWPSNQVSLKVAPALATGCTMVLKPSEFSPFTALIFAEIMDEAGVPAGVFNLVNGNGPDVGAALSSHPLVEMISITGSTRAGADVAAKAAATIKKVSQELGGKSANIILDDADLEQAVAAGTTAALRNAGQSCTLPSRMLVPAASMDDAMEIAKRTMDAVKIGDPLEEATELGPVVSSIQWERIQKLLEKGVAEGATLVTGGPGKPTGFETGYYVKPTVFGNVTNDMAVAQEEIFGPALSILGYRDEDEAVAIANDSRYGLSGYVQSGDVARAKRVARRMRTGTVNINGANADPMLPFGGYKQSGNGREKGIFGFEEFTEVKTIVLP